MVKNILALMITMLLIACGSKSGSAASQLIIENPFEAQLSVHDCRQAYRGWQCLFTNKTDRPIYLEHILTNSYDSRGVKVGAGGPSGMVDPNGTSRAMLANGEDAVKVVMYQR